jgi:hypothetical protein
MSKPITLLALKEMHRNWPAALGYPMLMAGLEFLFKSAWRFQGIKNNYQVSLLSIHEEMEKWIIDSNLPGNYRFGHLGVEDKIPQSTREEVLAIGLYNTLLYGKSNSVIGPKAATIDGFGKLSLIDYQVPVAKKGKDIGNIDLLGLVTSDQRDEIRPVIIELKGQTGDKDTSRRDSPHFAVLEAWIYFIQFYRNVIHYTRQIQEQNLFPSLPYDKINWGKPLIAIIAPQAYWDYWKRSDEERGYNGLIQFCKCCLYMSHVYSNQHDIKDINLLDVVGLSLIGLTDATAGTTRSDIYVKFDEFENVDQNKDVSDIEIQLTEPIALQWSISQNDKGTYKKSKFREEEREKQRLFKKNSVELSQKPNGQDQYNDIDADDDLREDFTYENLFKGIRESAEGFFKNHEIKWHPVGRYHVLSSQTYCVNFLFPFIKKPEALRELLKPIFPDIEEMLPIEDDGYVTFEWNGNYNYLKEHGYGKRGEMATYPDAAVKFRKKNGEIQIVLIEWKYTESYRPKSKATGDSGVRRLDTYRSFCEESKEPDCPINLQTIGKNDEETIKSLFYEPFYQLFREQLLANAIEKDTNNEARIVSVLHICPKDNLDFLDNVTSPALKERFPNKGVIEIWESLVKDKSRFTSTCPEDLFQNFPADQFNMTEWANYMNKRYHLSEHILLETTTTL